MTIALCSPPADARFIPRNKPYTPNEIKAGYAPQRDWKSIINTERELRKLLRKRSLISFGAFGVVYDVGGAALKIGCIGESEPAIQQWVYEQHRRALPVWGFKSDVALPQAVTHEICPRHGYLSELWPASSINCHCHDPLPVMAMPIADLADQNYVDSVSGDRIAVKICDAILNRFGVCFDLHGRNFLNFKGRLMLCDFGDPNDSIVDYW